MTEPDLRELPAPPIDPELSAHVRRRARARLRDRGLLPRERAVPALLLLAGVFSAVTSIELFVRLWG